MKLGKNNNGWVLITEESRRVGEESLCVDGTARPSSDTVFLVRREHVVLNVISGVVSTVAPALERV
jgi:hypothetical protein